MELDHWDNLLLQKSQHLDLLHPDLHLDLLPDLLPDPLPGPLPGPLPDPLPDLLLDPPLPSRSYVISTPFLKKEKNPKDANFPSVLKARPILIVQPITPQIKLNGVLRM